MRRGKRLEQFFLEAPSEKIGHHFPERLLRWFKREGRHHLPWKPSSTESRAVNLYRIWVSEIMLQQTQVATVIPYFVRFMERFPTIFELAKSDEESVLKLWEGLGYYSRARNLHHAAKMIVEQFEGVIPPDYEALLSLKGIGPTTASAILAQGYNLPFAILDGNVRRVLARLYGVTAPRNRIDTLLKPIADQLVPQNEAADYTQAIMDFGATLCARKAECERCFMQDECVALRHNEVQTIPRPNIRKAHPIKPTLLYLFEYEGGYFLHKRDARGIWGNLYSLPEEELDLAPDLDGGKEGIIEEHLAKFIQKEWIKSVTLLPQFTHRFSHYTLAATPILIELKIDATAMIEQHFNLKGALYTLDEWEELPNPKPILDLLEGLRPFSLEPSSFTDS